MNFIRNFNGAQVESKADAKKRRKIQLKKLLDGEDSISLDDLLFDDEEIDAETETPEEAYDRAMKGL